MEKLAHWHGRNNPSFSSSLLDAIYRSIDEPDSGSKRQIASIEKKRTPTPPPPANLRRHSSTSNSSDADTTARPRPVLTRCDRYCSDPPPERKRPCSIRTRLLNLRNLRAPASPGTRLAAFVNAIFAGGGGKPKKPKFAGGQEESARSCINKMPEFSRGGKQRSVRFSPASIAAVEGSREKRHSGEVPMVTRDRRLLLEELMGGFDMEEEESDCESVSSSELFELESLSAVGRFRDGLPVYETTNLSANRAVAHGFIV